MRYIAIILLMTLGLVELLLRGVLVLLLICTVIGIFPILFLIDEGISPLEPKCFEITKILAAK